MLKFVLLYFIPEEIGINSPDEREVILSEIYRRFHPEEEDLFEMEIQGEISRDVAKAWFSYVRKILDNRGFYFLPTIPDFADISDIRHRSVGDFPDYL